MQSPNVRRRKYPKFKDAEKYLECRVSSSPLGFLKTRAEIRALDKCLEGLTGVRTICDVPSGPGRLFNYWHSKDLRVIGGDLSGDMLEAARKEHAKLRLEGEVVECDAFDLKVKLTEEPDLVASVRFAYYFKSDDRVRLLKSLAAASRRYVLVQYKTTETLKGQMNIARATANPDEKRREHLDKEGCSHQRMADEVVKAGLIPLRIVPMGELSDRVFILAEKPGFQASAKLRNSIRDVTEQPSILFCGKHRVNFAMFHPVYLALKDNADIRLLVSTGRYRLKPILGWRDPKDPELVNENLYREFNLDPKHLHKTSINDKYPYDVFVTSNKTALVEPPNSRVKIQIFHGVSFRNFAVDAKYLHYDKLFFPGRYMMEQYIKRGILKEDDPRIELMGMPKLDRLVDGTIKREDVLKKLGLDPALPTILWCPTGARYNSYEILGNEGLKAVQATGYNLILKLHDHPHLPKDVTREQLIRQASEGMGERGRIEDHSDVAPLLVAADILISDASSVAYEFCICNRPIVFVDVPELINERAAMEGANIDEDSHGRSMGRIVKTSEELKEAIEHALKHPEEFETQRKATAEHIFYKPGTATKRMADRLLELAGAVEPKSESDSGEAQPIPRIKIKVRRPLRWIAGLAAAVVFTFVYGLNLADRSLWDAVEACHGLAARSVLEGHVFAPIVTEEIPSRSAPVLYWLTALLSKPFGNVSEWIGRSVSLLASIALLGLTLSFVRRWLNPWSAFMALVVLGTSFLFWHEATQIGPAAISALCLFVAWRALFPLMTIEMSYWPRWTTFWLATGVGVLTQGWSALFLTLALALGFGAALKGPRGSIGAFMGLRPVRGLALAMVPVALWGLGAWNELGRQSFSETFGSIYFVTNIGVIGSRESWHFYVPTLLISVLPWAVLLPWVFAHATRYVHTGPKIKARTIEFALCASVAPLLYYSLFQQKDAGALLASLPWIAMLIGDFVWHRLSGIVPSELSDNLRAADPLDTDARSFGGKLLGLGFGRFVTGAAVISALAFAVYSGLMTEYLDQKVSPQTLAAAIEDAVDSDDHLMLVDGEDPRLLFYLGESFELVDDSKAVERIRSQSASGAEMDMVLNSNDVSKLARLDLPGFFVGSTATYRDQLYYLITNEFEAGMDPLWVSPLSNPSGMCFATGRDTFFVVNDEGHVAEVARDGTELHSRKIGGDLEGVTISKDEKTLFIADESADEIHEVNAETLELMESYQIEYPDELEQARRNPEQGIEGIHLLTDPQTGKSDLYVVNEDNPPLVMQIELEGRDGDREGKAVISNFTRLDFRDLTELTASSGSQSLLAYSRADRRLVEFTPGGKVLRSWELPEGKREAMTLLADGTLYCMDESSLMRVFDPKELDRLLIRSATN